MLLSSNPPPAPRYHRGRSKSWGSDLHSVLLASSSSTPSLVASTTAASLLVSPHRINSRKTFPAAPESALIDVREGKELTKEQLQERPKQLHHHYHHYYYKKPAGAWDLHDTWQWYNELPWLAGMNYLPRTAVNFIEMWDESSFDIETIQEELQWAADKLGYNTLRTNLPMVLYEQDAEGLKKRVNQFLKVASAAGFAVTLVFLDDCEFSGRDPVAGPQPDPVPGLHNSQAVGSPGRRIVLDSSQWHRVENYVKWCTRTWGQDPRVFLLDLYNEPANPWVFTNEGTIVIPEVQLYEENAGRLMELVFQWAREEKPRQPLTVSAWHMPDPFFIGSDGIVPLQHWLDQQAMALSDVISIHAYCDHATLQAVLQEVTVHGKPILLTEWMARQVQSTYETALPTLKELRVGAYQWGLVRGKTQTHLPWPHVAHQFHGDTTWWHDVLDADGTFHNEAEGEIIRSWVYPQNKAVSSSLFLDEATPSSDLMMEDAIHQPLSAHSLLSQNHLSVHHLNSHHHLIDETEFPVVEEGQHSVIPSVCSISMATINAAAAAQAGEALTGSLERSGSAASLSKSMPTFGHHMSTPAVEGLDLAEYSGIEF